MRIPLPPVPESIGQTVRDFFSTTLPLMVYRLALLGVAVGLVYMASQSAGFLVSFLITSVIAAYYMDDITAALTDLWNANFAEVKL